jgi:hypothetical protein
MTNLTKTQSLILTTGAQRADNIAMPLPEGLHGAAAKKVVTMMCERGWLEEVDANRRKGEPLWRETGDGNGTTLVVTDLGLLAVGIEPVVVKAMAAVREHAAVATMPKTPSLRTGTKQVHIIALLQRPEGASIAEIVAVTKWLPHSIRA